MSNIRLLDKIRKIGKPFRTDEEGAGLYRALCVQLSGIERANVLLLDASGSVLAEKSFDDTLKFRAMFADILKTKVSEDVSERLLTVLSVTENVNPSLLGIEEEENTALLIAPIHIGGERLGTLLLYRRQDPFDLDDTIVCEYAMLAAGLQLSHEVSGQTKEKRRRKQVLLSAVDSLSPAELTAAIYVFRALGGVEGVLVASRVATDHGITRSVIVNALRKLEGAGVIEARSFGMKGTFLRVMDTALFSELERIAERKKL